MIAIIEAEHRKVVPAALCSGAGCGIQRLDLRYALEARALTNCVIVLLYNRHRTVGKRVVRGSKAHNVVAKVFLDEVLGLNKLLLIIFSGVVFLCRWVVLLMRFCPFIIGKNDMRVGVAFGLKASVRKEVLPLRDLFSIGNINRIALSIGGFAFIVILHDRHGRAVEIVLVKHLIKPNVGVPIAIIEGHGNDALGTAISLHDFCRVFAILGRGGEDANRNCRKKHANTQKKGKNALFHFGFSLYLCFL